jgi:peroxiredoxin family protein
LKLPEKLSLEGLKAELDALKAKVESSPVPEDKLSIIVFSGDMDKVMASLILATGAASMGTEVSLFFTFWGTSVLKKPEPQKSGKLLLQTLFGWMMPKGPKKLPLSKMNFGGAGPKMMNILMKKHNTASIEELLDVAQDCDIHFYICQMSMDLMGIKKEEIQPIENLKYCGVSKFLETSDRGKVLFI